MANLKSIKSKIISYKKTCTVTHAMEAVSAVKMRKGQERALSGRAYAASALSILERISATPESRHYQVLRMRRGLPALVGLDKLCVVVITSDKGLAGALNSGVIRMAEKEIASRGFGTHNTAVVAIGKRGADHFASRGYDVRTRLDNVSDGVSEQEVTVLTEHILSWHADGDIASCVVVYQNFVSTFEQEPASRQIIPLKPQMIAEMIAGIRPARGKYAPHSGKKPETHAVAYSIEPDADEVLSVLLPKLVTIALFHALLENKASEHSARMVAMKSATDKAKEMAHGLTRTFNKVRQAAITREVSEITSGIEAMK